MKKIMILMIGFVIFSHIANAYNSCGKSQEEIRLWKEECKPYREKTDYYLDKINQCKGGLCYVFFYNYYVFQYEQWSSDLRKNDCVDYKSFHSSTTIDFDKGIKTICFSDEGEVVTLYDTMSC